eukprot:TRINITY_DN9403_c0_g1_i1.p1 TRINITY_DN9403_c0_g1~~TRINITY_DN9403_c0_g1_i1.p1  ORF type:complete len:244 (-),score=30.30 TRINITY_DN9403_c0_g1_i1:54-785(-)
MAARDRSPFSSGPQEEWIHGPFDCCDDNSSRLKFLINCCCPGHLAGQIALYQKCAPPTINTEGLCPCNPPCIGLFAVQNCVAYSVAFMGLAALLDCVFVGEMRRDYNLTGSAVKDLLCLCCCHACVATQVQRELGERSPDAIATAARWDAKFDKAKGMVPKGQSMGDEAGGGSGAAAPQGMSTYPYPGGPPGEPSPFMRVDQIQPQPAYAAGPPYGNPFYGQVAAPPAVGYSVPGPGPQRYAF